jgi:hypothetical protein
MQYFVPQDTLPLSNFLPEIMEHNHLNSGSVSNIFCLGVGQAKKGSLFVSFQSTFQKTIEDRRGVTQSL